MGYPKMACAIPDFEQILVSVYAIREPETVFWPPLKRQDPDTVARGPAPPPGMETKPNISQCLKGTGTRTARPGDACQDGDLAG